VAQRVSLHSRRNYHSKLYHKYTINPTSKSLTLLCIKKVHALGVHYKVHALGVHAIKVLPIKAHPTICINVVCCVAVCCSVLQCVAVCCSVLQCDAEHAIKVLPIKAHPTIYHTYCNTLQHTATHCNTLQHTATHCNTLQHTATHCNTLSV